ncbi:MAG TPA: radical SAM protein [Nitrososphaera sp.]|jgi:DNA repair photolyase
MSGLWYSGAAALEEKKSKSILHPFSVKGYSGLAINPYQGCSHRCAYCYATYEWSPEFYDRIFAKSNADEVLEKQLAAWNSDTIDTVMVASATDAYQPAELRYGLTRRCVQVLQKYNVPYCVFTKSATIIERDLELHRRYRDNCFIIWSITTVNEEKRRVIEPGTPPARRLFETIKKFTDAGVCCGVNIDPIMPLVTDTDEELEAIVKACSAAGLRHVFGAMLRLRSDIWERMKIALRLLGIPNGVDRYMHFYGFQEPLGASYVPAQKWYADHVISRLERLVKSYGMSCEFPDYMGPRLIDRSQTGQTSLHNFINVG